MSDPAQLARRLTGAAHVVSVDPEATYRISDALSPRLSAFGGAVRLYWPGFSEESNPLAHPLWTPRSGLVRPADIVDELTARVGRAAALTFGVPSLELELRRESTQRALEDARRRRQAQAKEREAASTRGGLTAEEFREFSRELHESEKRCAESEERVLELETELEDERKRAGDLEELNRQAWALVGQQQNSSQNGSEVPTSYTEPTSVREAVDSAAETAKHVIFTQSALESADESQFSKPLQVLEDLLLLDKVAGEWASGVMRGDFRQAFEGRHGQFRGGISQTAATEYRKDYEVTYNGETVMLGPHLCRGGVGAPSTILRIYWYKDDSTKKLVVGHVGRKLRDVSNRN
jgi:hypothetical protein